MRRADIATVSPFIHVDGRKIHDKLVYNWFIYARNLQLFPSFPVFCRRL
jgi:hypothetical protein